MTDKRTSQYKQAVRIWTFLLVLSIFASAVVIYAKSIRSAQYWQSPVVPAKSCQFLDNGVCTNVKVTETYTKIGDTFPPAFERTPTATPKPRSTNFSKGYVSFYSNAGCLGCRADLKTASGEKFDENLLTLAHNQIKLGTKVRLTNLDNGKTVIAKVNDRGGFNRLGRIADLSLATCEAIGCKTDQSLVVIEQL